MKLYFFKKIIVKLLLPQKIFFLVIALLLIGTFFRFINLDQKVYWYDETITSLRIAGYRQTEVVQQIFDDKEISVQTLQKYQKVNPKTTLLATTYSLATEAPQHPPLYFLAAQFWTQWLGDSVTTMRSLSALISILIFPCLYWLCLELFGSSLTGWMAIALIAVSPFHVLYAQEAREYSLWTVTTLLSSTALLRAMRLKTKSSWRVYAVTIAAGLYSFTFSLFIVTGHSIYIITTEKFRLTKIVKASLFACFIGLLAFSPWILIIIIHLLAVGDISGWTAINLPLSSLIKEWFINFSSIFFDLNFRHNNVYLTLPILILEIYSIYFVCKKSPQKAWLFILTLVGVTAIALVLPDLLWGGRRSSVSRYFIPCYLGIHLSVAYLIATQITSTSFPQRKIWQIITAMLILCGILSCAISSQSVVWWNKYDSYDNPQVARTLNQANRPLLISDPGVSFGYVLSLSYLLAPEVKLQLFTEPSVTEISTDAQNIFLYRPSQKLRNQLETKYTVVPIKENQNFWRLER
ncbi:glycosyltransferase family 39 protein [Gloeocapsopsis crepidinum LEGE 06123]|uniref:Glycosyltransferase family 39 protein n=1 Tax=Gloeocapsopsis crepidinum LEGE 06123 TaxID=588587 RepID=A0ABR9UWF6_9CHRO|nr:glycosyltransferase family 39 protein [Gloeocapsopsis crepidinum]MBE9192373.1 glycosyltransferase family 39 protein [Gloeocapsopsis crepidinum LEGE 06123]